MISPNQANGPRPQRFSKNQARQRLKHLALPARVTEVVSVEVTALNAKTVARTKTATKVVKATGIKIATKLATASRNPPMILLAAGTDAVVARTVTTSHAAKSVSSRPTLSSIKASWLTLKA
jgi:hypothetical protein